MRGGGDNALSDHRRVGADGYLDRIDRDRIRGDANRLVARPVGPGRGRRAGGGRSSGRGNGAGPRGVPVPTLVHQYQPDGRSYASLCRVCFCDYDDARHLTPLALLAPEERLVEVM